MANPIYEFDPVTHITADALGRPGHRSFYIQAVRGLDRITLLCEKEQVQAMTEAIDEMLDNLEKQYSLMRDKDLAVEEASMLIQEPVEPLFRVGSMGLGYDENRDPLEVRLFASRAQMQVLGAHAKEIIPRGRSPEQRTLQIEAYVRRNGHGE